MLPPAGQLRSDHREKVFGSERCATRAMLRIALSKVPSLALGLSMGECDDVRRWCLKRRTTRFQASPRDDRGSFGLRSRRASQMVAPMLKASPNSTIATTTCRRLPLGLTKYATQMKAATVPAITRCGRSPRARTACTIRYAATAPPRAICIRSIICTPWVLRVDLVHRRSVLKRRPLPTHMRRCKLQLPGFCRSAKRNQQSTRPWQRLPRLCIDPQ